MDLYRKKTFHYSPLFAVLTELFTSWSRNSVFRWVVVDFLHVYFWYWRVLLYIIFISVSLRSVSGSLRSECAAASMFWKWRTSIAIQTNRLFLRKYLLMQKYWKTRTTNWRLTVVDDFSLIFTSSSCHFIRNNPVRTLNSVDLVLHMV